MRHRQHARADGSGGPAARSARDVRDVPRIARRAMELRFAGEREAKLAGVGSPKDDEPCSLEPFHMLAVSGGWWSIRKEPGASRHAHTRDRRREILHEERHATERPVGKPVGDCFPAVVVELHGDGVDCRIARLDALDRGIEEFVRRNLLAPNQIGKSQRVVAFVLGESAHRVSSRKDGLCQKTIRDYFSSSRACL